MPTSKMDGGLDVRIICHDLGTGGAARATVRVATAIREHEAINGIALTVRQATGPAHPLADIVGYPRGRIVSSIRLASNLARHRGWDRLPWTTASTTLHSRADVWTGIGRETNRAAPDVVNLHWLGTGTMSISEIGRIRAPAVMTLHDMWAFSGAEHYPEDERFHDGFRRADRPHHESGFDWNRRVHRRKARLWRRPMHIVTPSTWLARCVQTSALMKDWPVTVIPYPIDTNAWFPSDRRDARSTLGLPLDATLLLTGADGGIHRQVKGGDLLEDALRRLAALQGTVTTGSGPIELVTFGEETAWREPAGRLPFTVHHLGTIKDDARLRLAYTACDLMIVPSRLDNLPNTAIEAQACAVPVVAFAVGGLSDIVEDGVSGLLVRPLDTGGLASAIQNLTADIGKRASFGANARLRAARRFDPSEVAASYARVFSETYAVHKSGRR